MNLENLQRRVLRIARNSPPTADVPYAFEQRILHRLKAEPGWDRWADWATALWRGAALCLCAAALLTGWSFLSPGRATTSPDVAQQFETTVLAAVVSDQSTETSW